MARRAPTASIAPCKPGVLALEPIQSITLHGWTNPKRTLSWADVVRNESITVERMVVDAGISQEDLRRLQPDIREWIFQKYVSYDDVPYMTIFPLDPIEHLHGDISTLVEYQYPHWVLAELGLTYARMRSSLSMDARWMRLLDLSLREWMELGLTARDVQAMPEHDVSHVFEASRQTVAMRIGANESFGLGYEPAAWA